MMPPPKTRRFRSIVCAVDLSPLSGNVLRYASAMAGACGGTVTALYAIDPRLSNAAANSSNPALLEAVAKRDLDRFVRLTLGARRAASVVGLVRIGRAARVIIAEAGRLYADVVVIGTHARRGTRKFCFGSTAEAVLRRCRSRVLVVPPRAARPRPGWPGGPIVAAVGADRHPRLDIEAAARIAEVFGAWLSIAPVATSLAREAHARMIIYPLPAGGRFRMFRQGSRAYDFICRAPAAVLVTRTGRTAGARLPASRQAA